MSSPCPVFVPVPSPVPAHPASWRWAGAQHSAGVAHPHPLSAPALGGTGRAESRWAAPARWHLGHPTVRTRGHTSGFGRGRETPGSASAPLTWVSRGLGSGHSWGPAGVQPDPGSRDGPLDRENTPWRGRRGLSIPRPLQPPCSHQIFREATPPHPARCQREQGCAGLGTERGKPPPLCPERCGWSRGVEVTGGDTAAQKPPPEQWAGARGTQAATPPPTLAKEPGTSWGHPARAPGIPPEGHPTHGAGWPKGVTKAP